MSRWAFAALGLALACAPAASPPDVARNLILISIDTLRADHLGSYGHPLRTSPRFDLLASESVLFEQAQATASWTLPSHASMFTGLYPAHHGVRTSKKRLGDDHPSLATRLAQHGFATGGVVNAVYLLPRFGLNQGFETYVTLDEDHSRSGAASRVTAHALAWLEANRDRRVFLFIHYFDLHSDYRSLERYERQFAPLAGRFDGTSSQMRELAQSRGEIADEDAAHLARLYDAGIRQLDDELARLLGRLDEGGWLDTSLLVVTSDHGEEFQEHGRFLHGITHYQEVLRVPLLLRGPGLPGGLRIGEPVSLVDLVPTALGALGLPAVEGLDGVDLRPLWATTRAASPERSLFGETGPGAVRDSLRSVRRGRYKLLFDRASGRSELYDLAADAEERVDIALERPVLAAELRAEIEAHDAGRREAPEAVKLSDDLVERLKALGYL